MTCYVKRRRLSHISVWRERVAMGFVSVTKREEKAFDAKSTEK